MTCGELLFIPIGVAGGVLATLVSRGIVRVLFVGVGVAVFVPFSKPLVRPLSENSLRDQWQNGVCLQSSPSTCGAASLATILRSSGAFLTERQIAEEAFSYTGGTEAWYLARVARRHGMLVSFRSDYAVLRDIPLPVLVGVNICGFGHFIPILEKNDDLFLVGDPLRGLEHLSTKELQDRYHFTGFAMTIKRANQ